MTYPLLLAANNLVAAVKNGTLTLPDGSPAYAHPDVVRLAVEVHMICVAAREDFEQAMGAMKQ